LAFIALKQPVSTSDISASREVDSAATVQTLRERRLIEGGGVGPQREKLWRTTKLFLETFNLASLDDLYKEARFQEIFVYGSAADEVGDEAPGEVEASGPLSVADPLG
jgi:chromosome segregation and condensation protein ScpB